MSHPMANFDEKEIFFDESYVAKLGLIVTESAQELGKKINKHLGLQTPAWIMIPLLSRANVPVSLPGMEKALSSRPSAAMTSSFL